MFSLDHERACTISSNVAKVIMSTRTALQETHQTNYNVRYRTSIPNQCLSEPVEEDTRSSVLCECTVVDQVLPKGFSELACNDDWILVFTTSDGNAISRLIGPASPPARSKGYDFCTKDDNSHVSSFSWPGPSV